MYKSFGHTTYPIDHHAGIGRVQAAYDAARALGRGLTGIKGLQAVLLGGFVATLVVVANQAIDTWADDHLLAAWVALWAVAFFALGLFSGTARTLAARTMKAANAWSARVAQNHADARLWATAQRDPRVMAEITQALSRAESEAEAQAAANYSADTARSANVSVEIEAYQHRQRRREFNLNEA